jgi:hypothetical protein
MRSSPFRPDAALVDRVYDSCPNELSYAERLYGHAIDALRATDTRKHESPANQFAWLQLARLTSAFRAAITLFVAGSEVDCDAIGRTVVEVGIDLEYALRKPEERIEKYFNFGHLLAKRFDDALAKVYAHEDPEPARRDAFEQVRRELGLSLTYEEQRQQSDEILKKLDPNQKSWTNAGIDQRAEEIGAKPFAYDLVYATGCAASHSGVGGVTEFLDVNDVEPSVPSSSLSVSLLSGFFLSSLLKVTDLFALDQSAVLALGREMKLIPEA